MQFSDLKAQYAALKADVDARIQRVLDHGQYIMGPEVAELEAALADFTGARHCIAVASGTEALLIALMALGVKRGDEVITSPLRLPPRPRRSCWPVPRRCSSTSSPTPRTSMLR